jgi:hypothetical protein
MKWCRDNLPFFCEKEIWPPSSPDCNLMGYFVWGVSERDVNRSPQSTKRSLINSIKEVFSLIPYRDNLKRVLQALLVQARGGHCC